MDEPKKYVGDSSLAHFWQRIREKLDAGNDRMDGLQDRLTESTQAITNEELEAMLK